MSVHELFPNRLPVHLNKAGRYEPNAALDDGRRYFMGSWPLAYLENRPEDGRSVVYFLWTSDWSELLYAGSTMHFYQRMKQHKNKPFHRWEAFPCPDRESAYRFEARYLAEFMPPMNKRREPMR